jgi:uncharacterized protein (TIGR00725 family)
MPRIHVSVIGDGKIEKDDPLYKLASQIGKGIIDEGFRLVTGGLGGVMEAASKGARSSERYREGDVIGILPGSRSDDANPFVDIPIPTSLGISRNTIVTNTDAVIAVGGGSGTLSEIAFAWQKGKMIIALRVPGWSGKIADSAVDGRRKMEDGLDDIVYGADTADEALKILKEKLL